MESSTQCTSTKVLTPARAAEPWIAERWEDVVSILHAHLDMDRTARASRAWLRGRKVKSAGDLLRIVLAYAMQDWSLRLVGIWCAVIELANLSDVAILKRLRHCQVWLGQLVGAILQANQLQRVLPEPVCVRIQDGTTLCRPGSTGPDWRVHVSFNLAQGCLDGVDITDAHGGESLARYATRPNEIWLADRGYAYANSLGPVLAVHAQVVVRMNWCSLPLEDEAGQRVDIIGRLPPEPVTTPDQDLPVWLNTPQGRFAVRLIIAALPPEAAQRARQRVRAAYRKDGKTPTAATLQVAGFTLLVTSLPADPWTPAHLLSLYRVRWQVELAIKRLKSLLDLDHLRAQDPALVQVYLLGKLLGALLVDQLIGQVQARCPSWFASTQRPLSLWRLTAMLSLGLSQMVKGSITLLRILTALPHLHRFLCDSPRTRPQQLVSARSLLTRLAA